MKLKLGTNQELLLYDILQYIKVLGERILNIQTGGEQFDARDIIQTNESFEIDSLSQRIIKEQLLVEPNGELIINGRLYIE